MGQTPTFKSLSRTLSVLPDCKKGYSTPEELTQPSGRQRHCFLHLKGCDRKARTEQKIAIAQLQATTFPTYAVGSRGGNLTDTTKLAALLTCQQDRRHTAGNNCPSNTVMRGTTSMLHRAQISATT